MAKVRRESYSCTGRGFSMIDADGFMARLLDFATRPNIHGSTLAITTVDYTTNNFYRVGHGLVTGQALALTGTTAPAGLTLTTSLAYPFSRLTIYEYFAIRIDADNFKVATTHYNAMAGTAIDFTSNGDTVSFTALGGGAGWYLHDDFSRMAAYNFATTAVNTGAETITLAGDYFSHMHKVTFSSTVAVPGGLVAGTAYWLYRVSSGVYKVCSTEANAFAGTAINLTSQGTGTHTIITAEHFVIITDTISPSANDYNTSPAGCAPKYLKLGYVDSEAGYVRKQACLYWDATNHIARVIWSGTRLATYDSALFAYQFIGGDEFLFRATQLGATWYYEYIDTCTGITNKLEVITKVGVLQSGITSGLHKVLPLAAGQASDITIGKFYYLYDLVGHGWVNYVKIEDRDTGADTVTIDTCNYDFPAGAVLTPYAHRYYTYGTSPSGANLNGSYSGGDTARTGYTMPYCSALAESSIFHNTAGSIYGDFKGYAGNDEYISVGTPDDEGYYDCIRLLLTEYVDFAHAATYMNRIYGKSNNILKTFRNTMGQMSNTRTLNGIDYLYFGPAPTTYVYLVTYSESAS